MPMMLHLIYEPAHVISHLVPPGLRLSNLLSIGRYDETFAGEDGDFQQYCILTCVNSDEPGQPLLSLETQNGVQSVA